MAIVFTYAITTNLKMVGMDALIYDCVLNTVMKEIMATPKLHLQVLSIRLYNTEKEAVKEI